MDEKTMQIRILGPVEAVVDGLPVSLRGPRRKSVLAVLALHPQQVVGTDRLIDLVWDGRPPATAANTLQRHISYLRSMLGTREAIVARGCGYLLDVPPRAVDASLAEQLIERGRQAGDPTDRAVHLSQAVGLWRGPSLADVAEAGWLGNQALRLDGLRLDAVEELVDSRLVRGEDADLVPDLERLAAENPYREHLHEQLMLALYRSGRQADALAVVQRLRRTVGGEIGLQLSRALRELEIAILRQDRRLGSPARGGPEIGTWLVPAQLPDRLAAFAGRARELAYLDTLIEGTDQAATVVVVSGTAGVGKTALAVRWAHQVAGRYPHGQLYVNLRGFDPSGPALDPFQAMAGFLEALGTPPHRLPALPQAVAGLYRSVLAGRRVLIMADNARDEEQVRPLLPGTPSCLVIVTSRTQLSGLMANDDAVALTLGPPSAAEAREMLERRLGRARVAAEPRAVDEIVEHCARLPLALAVAAARAELVPTLSLAGTAGQLGASPSTLDCLGTTDPATDVRAVFSWSYRALSPAAARLFRLMSRCPGPDFGIAAAASVAGCPPSVARPLLAELTRANLLNEASPSRYGYHQLVRAYAMELADRLDSAADRSAARHRFLDHYLHTAQPGGFLVRPYRRPLPSPAPLDGVAVTVLADREQALSWFAAERPVLLAVMAREPDDFDWHTWRLGVALFPFFVARQLYQTNQAVQLAALAAAARIGDRSGRAYAHLLLGSIESWLGDLQEAERHSRAADELFGALDNHIERLHVSVIRFVIAARDGDLRAARRHVEVAHHGYAALGEPSRQAAAASNLAWLNDQLGELALGLVYGREALELYAGLDDPVGRCDALATTGTLLFRNGDPTHAADCLRRAIGESRRMGDRLIEAGVYKTLGEGLELAGRRRAARRAWRRALNLYEAQHSDEAVPLRQRLAVRSSRRPGRVAWRMYRGRARRLARVGRAPRCRRAVRRHAG